MLNNRSLVLNTFVGVDVDAAKRNFLLYGAGYLTENPAYLSRFWRAEERTRTADLL
jgi:hypothetical protein